MLSTKEEEGDLGSAGLNVAQALSLPEPSSPLFLSSLFASSSAASQSKAVLWELLQDFACGLMHVGLGGFCPVLMFGWEKGKRRSGGVASFLLWCSEFVGVWGDVVPGRLGVTESQLQGAPGERPD